MSDDAGKRKPSRVDQLDKALGVLITAVILVQYVDMVTHGGLKLYVRQAVARTRRAIAPRPIEPSPPEVSALHAEARRITREAAPDA